MAISNQEDTMTKNINALAQEVVRTEKSHAKALENLRNAKREIYVTNRARFAALREHRETTSK